MTTKKKIIILTIGIIIVLVSGCVCVTQPIPVFITGKLKIADGTYIAIANDTAYPVTTEEVYNKIVVNQTNYLNFDANSIGIPGGTTISGVHNTRGDPR